MRTLQEGKEKAMKKGLRVREDRKENTDEEVVREKEKTTDIRRRVRRG